MPRPASDLARGGRLLFSRGYSLRAAVAPMVLVVLSKRADRNSMAVQSPVLLIFEQSQTGHPKMIAIGFEQAFCQGTKSEGGGAGERLGCGVLGAAALGTAAAPCSR